MNPEKIDLLSQKIVSRMSGKRLKHTLEVEKMVARLADLYCPDLKDELRVAGLLHDITKELTVEQHLALGEKYGIIFDKLNLSAPKTLHAITAEQVIAHEFSEYATPVVLTAVRYHTTGRANMTLPEKLLYLADYIDMSRTYPACVLLRDLFWNANPQNMNEDERIRHLDKVLITSFDLTMKDLLEEKLPISPDTVNARNSLLIK